MKRVIVIVLIMTVVAGGAIAGLMVLDIVPNPFSESEEEMAGGEGEGGEPSFVPPERAPMLYPLEDMVIPVIIDGQVIKRVYITARMEISQGNRAAVENGLSRMESKLNEYLIVYFQRHFSKNRRPDPRGIKRVMVRAANDVYGEMVPDVLLLTIFEQ